MAERYDLSNGPVPGVTMPKGQLVTPTKCCAIVGEDKEIPSSGQPDGLRLLLMAFLQQFNATHGRRTSGRTTAATHTGGDIWPNEHCHRIDTPSLRGANAQRGVDFDGDIITAEKKGVRPLERSSQVHAMAEFQALLDFLPEPKLDVFGKFDPVEASRGGSCGQDLFISKAKDGSCHVAPCHVDNLMRNLRVGCFYEERMSNGVKVSADDPIKAFPLRGIKNAPSYLHDDCVMTLDDVVEFFNLVLELKLMGEEKNDIVVFLQALECPSIRSADRCGNPGLMTGR